MANFSEYLEKNDPNYKKPYTVDKSIAQKKAPTKPVNPLGSPAIETVKPEKFGVKQFVESFKETPSSIAKIGKTVAETFFPAGAEFVKTTTGIFSEGLALQNKTFRNEVLKGNLELVPTLNRTDLTDLAKKSGATMLEASVYKIIPSGMQAQLRVRMGIGALQGVGFAISEGLAKDYSNEEIINNAKSYAVFGLAGEMVAPYIAKILQTNLSKAPKALKEAAEGLAQEFKKADFSIGGTIEDVSKKDIPAPKKAETLAQEARKYKNVEEFVKVQLPKEIKKFEAPNVLYRAKDFSSGYAELGNGLYGAQNPAIAKLFGNNIEKITIREGANIIKEGSSEFESLFRATNGDAKLMRSVAQARKIDGIKGIDPDTGTVIFNESIIKSRETIGDAFSQTKSQLTDFYNQAIKTAPEPPKGIIPEVKEDASKYFKLDGEELDYIRAEAETLANMVKRNEDGLFNGLKSKLPYLTDDIKNSFQKWVNARSAAKVEQTFKKRQFANLDKLGMDGITEFQAGSKKPEYAPLRKYFDDKFTELDNAGVSMDYLDNYLPQLWEEKLITVREKMGRTLTAKPGFSFDRIFENYQQGIKAGLTPKFNKLSELAGYYEYVANKAIADKEMLTFLTSNKFISPKTESPLGWKTLDPDYFPLKKVLTKDGNTYAGPFSASPELADVLNNYLRPGNEALSQLADYTTSLKNIVLSAGIPKTGLNAHGFNILKRHMDANGIFKGFFQGMYYLIRPQAAEEVLMANMRDATYAIRHGLTLSAEEHILEPIEGDIAQKFTGRLRDFGRKYFEKPLFNQVLPALKVQYWASQFDDLRKYYPDEEAAKLASKITNSMYGGVNWEQLGRSRDLQYLLRIGILAPDWAETTVQQAVGITKGVFKPGTPELKAFRTVVKNLVMGYVAANATNYFLSGHFMFQNSPGHTFEIQIGKSPTGKQRYFKFAGTANDYIRIPTDVVLSLAQGDLSTSFRAIRNRLSIPGGVAASLVTNTDWAGRPILGKDRYGNEIPITQQVGGVASQVSSLYLPQYGGAVIDWMTGRQDWEQALMQSIEAPARYSYPKKGTGPQKPSLGGKTPKKPGASSKTPKKP